MTHRNTKVRHEPLHQQVWEVLPWYINETLSEQERVMVEEHLQVCVACQEECARCRVLATAVQAATHETWEPSRQHFNRLMARLEASAVPRTPWQKVWQRLADAYAYFQQLLQHTPRPVQWTLAAQGALAMLLLGGLVWQGALWPVERQYRTLTSGRASTPVEQPQLRVVFADSITEKELRALLGSIQGTIVHGPSSAGVYTIAVSPVDNTSERLSSVLATLRAHPQVRLTEPQSGW